MWHARCSMHKPEGIVQRSAPSIGSLAPQISVQDYTQILSHLDGQIKDNERRMGTLIAQNEAVLSTQVRSAAALQLQMLVPVSQQLCMK